MDGRDLVLSLGLVTLCAVLEFVPVRFAVVLSNLLANLVYSFSD